jgi:hypothetical protein
MNKNFFPPRLILAFLIFVFFALPLCAQEQEECGKISWFVNGSVLFFSEDNGLHSDPMPVLPSLGAGISYPFTDNFRAELSLDFYYTHYGYDYDLDRAVPYAIENRSAQVIGSLLALQAAWYFNVSSLLTIRAYGGPAADLRIVLLAEDLNEPDMDDATRQTDSVRNYFWSQGRWFMPVVGAGLDFALNERFKIGVDMRVWTPIYRLWTGEDLPAIEGWRFGPGIRLTIR